MGLRASRYFARRPNPSRVRDDGFVLGGGLNLVDSPLLIQPGELIACKNYEIGPQGTGYRRVRGFERYANAVIPSQAIYAIVNYDRATAVPAIGSLVVGATSAAQGTLIAATETQPVTTINLLQRSEGLDNNSVWTLQDVTIAASNIANPLDGTLNAEFIAETASNTEHGIRQNVTKDGTARRYWFSVYARPAGGTANAALRAFFNVSSSQILFDFGVGNASAVSSAGDFVGLEEYMLKLPDGWWRLGIKFLSSVQPSMTLMALPAAPGGILSYPGTVSRGLELYGMQLEETTAESVEPSAYVPTDDRIRGNGRGQLALIQILAITGVYLDNERLTVAGVGYAQADGQSIINGASTDELDATYRAAARSTYRLNATSVAGAGQIRGVAIYKGLGVALRDNVGATAGVLHRASTGNAWNPIVLGFKLRFTAGLAAGLNEGDVISGGTSGALSTVLRLVVQSGAFASNNAAGYIVIASAAGTFTNGEQILSGGTPRATANGTQVAQTLLPGGRLEHRVHNFFGHTKTERLYGVDGKNRAFEYQDANPEFFHQIETGMTTDIPEHLAVHDNQLFLTFSGGSLQKSAVGTPESWLVSLGAAELALGVEITALLEEIGETLFVFGRNKTMYLAGTPSTYALKDFSPDTGAHEWSVQRIGQGIYLDDRGFTSLAATQKFGNYIANSFTAKVETLVTELRKQGAVASCVVKSKNVYRCFFLDGRFVSIGVNGPKVTGVTNGDLGKIVRCVDSAEDLSGNELILFGSDDGWIYRMESGGSFDGSAVEAFFRTAFHFSKSPQRRKRYRRAAFHIESKGPCTLKVGTDYSFADPGEAIEAIRSVSTSGGGGLWNVSQWNSFRWSTGVIADASIKLEASGTNIGFLFSHEATDEEEHTISSVLLSVSPRRQNRGASHG